MAWSKKSRDLCAAMGGKETGERVDLPQNW
jgi:hypothetical protein